MIDLLASDDRAGFGLACALDVEGIPYRRIARPEEFAARVLVVAGGDHDPGAAALAARVPTVAVGAPATLARELFGVRAGRTVVTHASVSLDGPLWPDAVRRLAHSFGKTALALPRVPLCTTDAPPAGTTLATLVRPGGAPEPAVVRRGDCWWCLPDLGTALADLLDEACFTPAETAAAQPMPRAALGLYYRTPEVLRAAFQRRVYRRLEARLASAAGTSEYPVDATGWLVIELVKQLVRSAGSGLVRLARWPAPYAAAAALTHDLEPSRFAYTAGLGMLAGRLARSGHPATLGVVARPAARHLTASGLGTVRRHEVLCHGLEHRGETLVGSRERVAAGIVEARTRLEAQLGRPVAGFRSPRLDRSPALLWALDHAGMAWDSSYPDVDRENVAGFGGGVRLNVPFRPPLDAGEGRVRASRCLELPVSAPDCIQPLFAGDDLRALRRAVREKLRFVRATGGLYVGIVHGGVFGRRDAARRGAHLAFVRRQLDGPEVWLASAGAVADWWCARERLTVSTRDGGIRVTNAGDRAVAGVRVITESGTEETMHDLPVLAPGESAVVDTHAARLGRALGA